MQHKIEILKEKKLVGNKLTMSLTHNTTGALWKSFMQRRSEITNSLNNDLISMQIYKPEHFSDFDPDREFEKWAVVEVADLNHVPSGMESFVLPGGRYAVFSYKGLSTDPSVFEYIFRNWLPSSGFTLDNSRPHFEVLGERYKNNDPASEEEIWIPVIQKI